MRQKDVEFVELERMLPGRTKQTKGSSPRFLKDNAGPAVAASLEPAQAQDLIDEGGFKWEMTLQ